MLSLSSSYLKPKSKASLLNFFYTTPLCISKKSKDFVLSDLLPYDAKDKTNVRLKHGIAEYILLLNALEESMLAIDRKDYSSFDPLVGENACQIRAVKICLIFLNHPINTKKILEKASSIKDKLNILYFNIDLLIQKNYSLSDLLRQENLEIELTHNESFLIKSYLLTKVKILRPPKEELPFIKNEYTDTKKIKELGSVGTMFSESLIKSLRISVSQDSARFIQELALDLNTPDIYIDAVSEKYVVQHRNLQCLSCYWMTLILFLEAQKHNLPLIIIASQLAKDNNCSTINETVLHFEHTEKGYREAKTPVAGETPAIILMSNSCRNTNEFPSLEDWRNELLSQDPLDLILAYAACHRQYPDESKDDIIIKDDRFEYYKAKGEEYGCSISNPFGFFLAHAFCDTLDNVSKHTMLKLQPAVLNLA